MQNRFRCPILSLDRLEFWIYFCVVSFITLRAMNLQPEYYLWLKYVVTFQPFISFIMMTIFAALLLGRWFDKKNFVNYTAIYLHTLVGPEPKIEYNRVLEFWSNGLLKSKPHHSSIPLLLFTTIFSSNNFFAHWGRNLLFRYQALTYLIAQLLQLHDNLIF